MKISVILLTHNRENLVGRAIESILSQTMEDFEFILVDNGSCDGSGRICEEYKQQDSRIRVIRRQDKNIGAGRNAGLSLARGNYVTFIDDDDYAEPDMLEFLYRLIQDYQADISICGSFKDVNGTRTDNFVYDKLYVMEPVQAVTEYLRRKLYNAAMPTKLIRKELFDSIPFFSHGAYDDIAVGYRYFAHAKRTAALGTPQYTFYRHEKNNSLAAMSEDKLHPEQLKEYFAAFKERTRYLREVLPEVGDLAQYSEWSYLISMCNKIISNHLSSCAIPLSYIKRELKEHSDEFLESCYIQPFEKEWMKKYIIDGGKNNEVNRCIYQNLPL